jgi:TonB-linked SusC/RagA family outer membrane protein
MKLIVLFTFATILNSMANVYSQADKISLSMDNATVSDVLNAIEQQSKFKFFYQNEQIDATRLVNLNVNDAGIEDVMKKVFTGKKIKTLVLNDNLVVLTKEELQQNQVSGTVKSTAGEPMPGVNIVEKGTTNGVVTDLEGNFSIQLQGENPILVFSFLGFLSQEITVGNQTVIDVNLAEDIAELEEIVVVGYGSIKKSDLTGSVGSLDDEAMTERSVNNPMQAIQGSVAGVNISSSTGRLGDPFKVNIRGSNILDNDAAEREGTKIGGTSQPLFIVDGVVSNGIDFLNPQDIARMDVLKDASSTAIYGSRGANGVVIVTTKSGSTARKGVHVSLDSYYGVKKVARMPEFMDGQTWWQFHQTAYTDEDMMAMSRGKLDTAAFRITKDDPAPYGQNEFLIRNAETNTTTDWIDLVLQDGMMANNYLSISGAGENVSYSFGAGVQNETGLIQRESLDKYTLKAGFDSKVNKVINLGTNLTFAKTNQQMGSDRAMENAFRLSPLMSPYEVDGVTLCKQPGKLKDEDGSPLVNKTSTWNPLLEIPNASDLTNRVNFISSSYIQIKPLSWLSLKSTLSIGYDNRNRGQSWGPLTEDGSKYGNQLLGQVTKTSWTSYTWDNQVNIDKNFDDHSFNFLGLFSRYSNVGERTYAHAKNMPFATEYYYLSSGAQSSLVLSPADDIEYEDDLVPFWSKQTLESYALRINYSYQGKYLLTVSNRWDGSSNLSEGNKWDAFPSAAVAWRIAEEDYMQNQDIVSNLKLRVSLGYTGNNVVDPYSSIPIINQQFYYSYDESTAYGWGSKSLPNNTLTWEKTRELNFGIDYGVFRNRINGGIDIYDRFSSGIIMTERVPLETGWNDIKANIGEVSNKGIELSLNTVNVQNEKIFWETSFIFSKNVNKIISIHGQTEKDDIGNNLFIGESINSIYNYEFDGIVQANEADNPLYTDAGLIEGSAKVKDLTGDGVLDDDDRKILGSADPKWTGTITSRLTAYNFDFSFSIISVQGVLVNSPFHRNFIDLNDRGRQKLNVDWYVPENNVGLTPNFTNEYPRPRREGRFWRTSRIGNIKDASYTKIKNISIGYTIPGEALSRLYIQSLRIYFNVIDPFVFTEYEGYDPEWATASLRHGRVGHTTYQVGFNLKF